MPCFGKMLNLIAVENFNAVCDVEMLVPEIMKILPRKTRGIAPARFSDNVEAGPSSTPLAGPGSARPSSTPSRPAPAPTSPGPGLAPPGTPPGLESVARPALLPFSPVRALGVRRRTRKETSTDCSC